MSPKLILCVAMICPFIAAAQANYKEGYVITTAGDTLKGFINYREWYINPDKIGFKQGAGNAIMDITPATAKEVTITGFDTYQRFEVAISMNAISAEKLRDTATTVSINKTVFLRKLLQGDILNLYAYTDKLKVRFYILEHGKNTPAELLYVKTVSDMQEQTEHIYREQLTQIAIDHGTYTASLKSKIQSGDYSESSLENIVSRINTSSESAVKGNKNRPRGTSYFAGVGIAQGKISYTGTDFITADGLDNNGNSRYKKITTTNVTPRIAIGINFYSKEQTQRLSLKTELSAYHFASATTSYTRYNGTTAENHYTYNMEGWNFTFTIGGIYKLYSTANLKAYVGAGLGMSFSITGTNSIYKVGINQTLTYNETTNDYLPLKNLNPNLTARAGVVLNKKIDLYIYGGSPLQYSFNSKFFSVKSNMLAFCAAYIF